MAQVFPFRAFRFNPQVAPFDRVLTQPYDKISPERQAEYYAMHPHNLIIVEKGRAQENDDAHRNVYTRAAATVEGWIREAVLLQDPVPAFYAYTREIAVPGSKQRATRRGFIGAGQLEDYSAGIVFRHEHTLSGPKADRLELLRRTRLHTGQLFMLYSDPQKRVDAVIADVEKSAAPLTVISDEYGVVHRLWPCAEPERVQAIQQPISAQILLFTAYHQHTHTTLLIPHT